MKAFLNGEKTRTRNVSRNCLKPVFNLGQNCGKLTFLKSYRDVILVPPGHATVDAKVDGVGEEDAGVDEHGHSVGQLIVNEVQVHAGIFT